MQNKIQTIINAIIAHPNTDQQLLPNNYLRNHLEAINNLDNLVDIFCKLEEDETMGDTYRNGKPWSKCDCC